MVYDIPDSEKRALNLPIYIVKPDGSKVLELAEDRGNEALAFLAMYGKIKDAIEELAAYSAQFERIDDKRFRKAEQIKNELFGGGELRGILLNIIKSPYMAWDRKMELAEFMFSLSTEYIVSALAKDSKYQNTIVAPLRDAAKHLNEMMNEIRENRELQKDREEMLRRSSQAKSIRTFQPMQDHYNVMCSFCARTSHNESLITAIHKVQHEQDCVFREHHDLHVEQLLRPEILAHYSRASPLNPSKEQRENDKVIDGVERGIVGQPKKGKKQPPKKRGAKAKYI